MSSVDVRLLVRDSPARARSLLTVRGGDLLRLVGGVAALAKLLLDVVVLPFPLVSPGSLRHLYLL